LYEKFYANRETTDAFRFFDDAIIIGQQLWIAPGVYFKILLGIDMQNLEVVAVIDQLNNWYKEYHYGVFNDNQTVIRFNALLMPFSFGFYHVHSVVLNLLSFTGILAMLRAFHRICAMSKIQIVLILLFPQVLFWTSGVLKEGILMAVLGWFIWLLFALYFDGFTKVRFLLLLTTVVLMIQIKSYVLFCMLPGITLLFVARVLPQFRTWAYGTLLFVVQVSAVVLADFLKGSPRAQAIYQKQHDFINVAKLSDSGSYFESFVLEPNWVSIIQTLPEALFNTVFRPLIWNCENLLMFFASLENLLLFLLVLLALFFRKSQLNKMAHFQLFLLGSALILFTLVGIITPVSGALVRYKIPFLPFVLFWIWIVLDVNKMKKFIFSRVKFPFGN
jgi:hypothetical protein